MNELVLSCPEKFYLINLFYFFPLRKKIFKYILNTIRICPELRKSGKSVKTVPTLG